MHWLCEQQTFLALEISPFLLLPGEAQLFKKAKKAVDLIRLLTALSHNLNTLSARYATNSIVARKQQAGLCIYHAVMNLICCACELLRLT